MANLTTAADIIDDVLFRAGEPTDGTSDFNAQVLIHLNRVYQALWMGGGMLVPDCHEDWWWLRKSPPGVLTLLPAITGSAVVANNNTAVTLTAAATPDMDNWFFKVDDHADVFRVSSHTAGGTAVVLDSVYTGEAGTKAYTAFKLEYDLASDVLKIVGPMRQSREDPYVVGGVDLVEMERNWPLPLIQSGTPTRYAHVDENTVRFNKYPGTESTDYLRVEYDYLYKPDDLTDAAVNPVVPRQYLHVLSDYTLYFALLDKNDNRADAAGIQAKNGLMKMMLENRKRQTTMAKERMGQILPRLDEVYRDRGGVVRTAGGLIIG